MSVMVVKADWVIKSPPESTVGMKHWKTRVLALLHNERLQEWTLKYYKDQNMNEFKGEIALTTSTQLYRPLRTSKDQMHLFAVRPGLAGRTYYFACFTQEQREGWLGLLSSVLQLEVIEGEIKDLPGSRSSLNRKLDPSYKSYPTSPEAVRSSKRPVSVDALTLSQTNTQHRDHLDSPLSPDPFGTLPRRLPSQSRSMDFSPATSYDLAARSESFSPASKTASLVRQKTSPALTPLSPPTPRGDMSLDGGYHGAAPAPYDGGLQRVPMARSLPASERSLLDSPDDSGQDTSDRHLSVTSIPRSQSIMMQRFLTLLEKGCSEEELQQEFKRTNFSADLVSANFEGDNLLVDFTAGRQETRQLADLKDRLREQEWSRSDVTLIERIGTGFFGEVWLGKHKKTGAKLAVKLLQGQPTTKEKIDFLEEAVCMSKFDGNEHVLGLTAVQTKSDPAMIMTEFMVHGSIQSYIRDPDRQTSPMMLDCQLWLALQVTVGMNYLNHEKRFVHRDLAARNVLLTEDSSGRLLAKVADFGLSRSIYHDNVYRQRRKHLPLPIKWMAKECMEYGVYTHETDVWSFGVFLWELMSGGRMPYPGVSSEDMYIMLTDKQLKLSHPHTCPADVHAIMLQCTEHDPDKRPTFSQLCHILGEKLKNLPEGDRYPVKEKLDAVDKSLQSTTKTTKTADGKKDTGYVPMFKLRRSLKRSKKGNPNEPNPIQTDMTINDIPCLQAVKHMNSGELYNILSQDVSDEEERDRLSRSENRSNTQWLQQQVEIRWLRRGDQTTPEGKSKGVLV